MKMGSMNKLMIVVGMFTVAATAFANEGMPGAHPHKLKKGKAVEARIQNQERRIQQGVEKGKLTQEQANQLQQNVDTIKAEAKSDAESGGKVTKEERMQLKEKLKASSDAIRNAKHPEGSKPAQPTVPAPSVNPSTGK